MSEKILRLINFACSNYGIALSLVLLPIVVIFPPLHESPVIYKTCLGIVIFFDILLLVIKGYESETITRIFSFLFPACGVAISLIPFVLPNLLDWPVVIGGLIFVGILEAVVLKPENLKY